MRDVAGATSSRTLRPGQVEGPDTRERALGLACRVSGGYDGRDWKGGSSVHGMKEIIEEAECLPVEERVLVIDSLLRTINPPSPEVEIEWVMIAGRRLAELRSGHAQAVPGSEVFDRIHSRFEK